MIWLLGYRWLHSFDIITFYNKRNSGSIYCDMSRLWCEKIDYTLLLWVSYTNLVEFSSITNFFLCLFLCRWLVVRVVRTHRSSERLLDFHISKVICINILHMSKVNCLLLIDNELALINGAIFWWVFMESSLISCLPYGGYLDALWLVFIVIVNSVCQFGILAV